MSMTITGPLHLYSETGTEGGYWAIQDDEFITPAEEKSPHKHCKRCGRWWQDAENGTPEPPPSFTYWTPRWDEQHPTQPNTTIMRGGYQGYDEPQEDGLAGPADSFDEKWNLRGNANSLICYNDGHDWDWAETHDQWSYEGLHTLESGDVLTVFDKEDPTKELFAVTVDLVSNYDQYRADAKNALGWVIHTYPNPETCYADLDEWSRFFHEGYPAQLDRVSAP